MIWQTYFQDMDRMVFQDRVSAGVQRDGQRVLDAAISGDLSALRDLALKYSRDVGLAQGGGGAGPGKVKTARSGAVTVGRLAMQAADRIQAIAS